MAAPGASPSPPGLCWPRRPAPTGPGHLGDVGVLSPRVDQGGVTPAAFCQEDASRVDEDEPREDQAIHQWMSSSPKGGVCGHGSGLDLS